MKSPWKSLGRLEPDRSYLVLESSIPPRKMSSTWRMFRGASAFASGSPNRKASSAFPCWPRLLRKQYPTLSVWSDDEALLKFAGAAPHHKLMDELSPEMGATKFVRWTISGSDGRPSWNDALQRLG